MTETLEVNVDEMAAALGSTAPTLVESRVVVYDGHRVIGCRGRG